MTTRTATPPGLSHDLIEAIREFPTERRVEHCDTSFGVSPFDFYATCPSCGTRMKVRGLSAVTEIEDVFDAVMEWMNDPATRATVAKRRDEIADDED